MRRAFITAALSAACLFALGGTALAGDHVPPPITPTPAPTAVTDTTTAAAFAKLYVARNAGTLLGVDGRRVRVTDDNAACLAHPVVANRFGCVFTLRAAVLERARSWDDWGSVRGLRKGHKPPRPTPTRVRQFGCLGALTINGGAGVTPTAQVRFVDCVRVARDLSVVWGT